ncbi:MAG: hypothetical protein ABIK61_06530 [candidate division WOR-3 bacterium]
MKVYVCKLAWSSSGWKGLPSNKNDYNNDVNRSQVKYVRNKRYAYEWWNFSEELDDKYYIGSVRFAPNSPIVEDNSIVIFISYDVYTNQMKFIGFYIDAKQLLPKELEDYQKKLKGLKLPYELSSETQNAINESYFDTRAPKDKSLILSEYYPVDTKVAFGRRFGNVFLQELNEEQIYKALSWIENNKNNIINNNNSVEKINNKIENLIRALRIISYKPMLNILSAINTKPFIILSGISGTGKTQIARIISTGLVEGG